MDKLFSPSELLFHLPTMQLKQESMKEMFVGLGSNGKVVGFGIVISVAPEQRYHPCPDRYQFV